MTARLKSHSEGQTLVLTLSNPEHRNALGPDVYAAGIEALNASDGNPDVRSVLITGEGSHFCAGGDLQRLLRNRSQAPSVQAQSIEALHNWIEVLRAYPKPVVAAVEGACAGAGFSLALACDMLVAADNAVFVMAYSNVGLSPDGGASWSLGRALPRNTAMQLLLCGERIGAARLQQFGLVNQVCAPGQALSTGLRLCEQINQRAPNAMASIKELLNEASQNSLNQQLRLERDHFVQNLHHKNGAIGINAFLEKFAPDYQKP